MNAIQELEARKQKLLLEGRGFLSKAQEEDRALSEEEDGRLQEIDASIERIHKQINQERQLEAYDRQILQEIATGDRQPAGGGSPDPNRRFNSLGEQLVAVVGAARGGRVDSRLNYQAAVTGMSEGVPSEGGYLVEKDFVMDLMRKVHDTGALWARTRNIPVGAGKNGVRFPYVDETSRATGSRWGGVRAYWLAEGGTKTASKPKFGRMEWEFKKTAILIYATDELLSDAVALEGFISQAASEEFGFTLDDSVVNGDGVGKPLGWLNASCLVSVAKETGQAAATVLSDNIEKMFARMWPRSLPRATWYMNQNVWPQIFQLHHVVGTGGVPMFIPPGMINNAPFGTLLGRPIEIIEQAETLGTKGDIVFADLGEYGVIDKGGIEGATSIHVKFDTDETAFRFIMRVDGQPIWKSALTPYKGSATVSPFISLDTRA